MMRVHRSPMAFDDLTLDRPTVPAPSPPPAPRQSAARWMIVVAAALIAAAALTFWWMSRTRLATTTPAPTTSTEVAIGSNRPKRQAIDLPPLDESDTVVHDLISALSKHPTLARLLASPGLVRGATLAVVQIGDGRTPADPLKSLKPSARMQILGTANGFADPQSYARHDGSAAALASVSPSDAAQLYVNVKPLFDRAYIELGHPGGDFDEAIVRAIQMVNDTPVLPREPMLLRRSGYFEYDDLTLRTLPPVQKQLLMLGPDNRRKVSEWLKQFASALDLKTN